MDPLLLKEETALAILVPNMPIEDCRLAASDAFAFKARLLLLVNTSVFREELALALFGPSVCLRKSVNLRRLLLLCYDWY